MNEELLARIKKASVIKETSVFSTSKLMNDRENIVTSIPALNIAFSGDVDGGYSSGLNVIAGASKHFKTLIMLLAAKAYLDKYKESVMIFYDSEFGALQDYFKSVGIDTDRVVHIPVKNIEELKFDVMQQLELIKRGDKVFIGIDSVGNLASVKEMEDAINQKAVADMSRAKSLKALFRMVTPYLTMNDIPMFAVAHTYQTQEMFSKTVVSGGCLVTGTNIRMANGSLKPIEAIQVGEVVQTLNIRNNVTHTWNPDTLAEGNPECLEIEFADGLVVGCSLKHPFMVNGDWVEAQKLTIDDQLDMFQPKTMGIKSITPIGKQPVYDISVDETEHYVLENGVVTHNTGIYYSATNIYIMGRQQEKDAEGIAGYNFIMNVEKSRQVREKSKIPLTVLFNSGINRYSGLIDIAVELGAVVKPSNGWYSKVDLDTGEVDPKKYRAKETDTADFWDSVLKSQKFKDMVKNKFQLAGSNINEDEVVTDDE